MKQNFARVIERTWTTVILTLLSFQAHAQVGGDPITRLLTKAVDMLTNQWHRRNMAELAREIARGKGDVAAKAVRAKPATDEWLIPVEAAKGEHPEWLVPAGRKRP